MTDSRSVSFILKALLDALGLDEEHRQMRITYEKMKQIISLILADQHNIPMPSGSSFETTTIDGLSSDLDMMFVKNCNCQRIIADIREWRSGDVFTYLIDSTGCYKGFVKLYLLGFHYPDYARADMLLNWTKKHEMDSYGRLLLCNNLSRLGTFNSEGRNIEFHGPAITAPESIRGMEADTVFALPCDSFPKEASWWKQRQTPVTRTRIDPALIDDINHCYLVPVGNKASPTENVEWRLSFNHIENQLVHLWNNVQYQCYVLMKFIHKDLIKPAVPDFLCSYHVKTLMLWMNEEFPTEFFTVSNFEQCVLLCLKQLSESVKRRTLPHYFVKGCNVFYPKLTNNVEMLMKLDVMITRIIQEWPFCLFAVSRCNLGRMFYGCIRHQTPLQSIASHVHEERRQTGYYYERVYESDSLFHEYIRTRNRIMSKSTHPSCVFSEINKLLRSQSNFNNEGRQFIDFAIRDLLCNIGLQWIQCSRSVSNKAALRNISAGLKYIQRYSNSCCIDTGLKIAAHFVKTQNHHQAFKLLDKVEAQMKSFTYSTCHHIPKIIQIHHRVATYDNKPTITEFCKHYKVMVVAYCLQSMEHIPKGLVYQLFESTSVLQDPGTYFWGIQAFIHCPVYLYYLRFLTYQAQGRRAHRQVALDNMEWAAKHLPPPLTHVNTILNIIGHCHRSTGNTRRAYKRYRESLDLKKDENAVLWHLAVFLRSQIRGDQ